MNFPQLLNYFFISIAQGQLHFSEPGDTRLYDKTEKEQGKFIQDAESPSCGRNVPGEEKGRHQTLLRPIIPSARGSLTISLGSHICCPTHDFVFISHRLSTGETPSFIVAARTYVNPRSKIKIT